MGKQWKQWLTLFFWAPKSLQMVIAAMKLKDTLWWESYDHPRQHIQKQRHYFANKDLSSQDLVFPVVMYGCESWTIKKAEHWRTDPFELWCGRRFLSLLDSKEIQQIHPKDNKSWMFIGRTDAEAPIFGHLMRRANSLEKTLMLGKIEGKRRRGWQRMR